MDELMAVIEREMSKYSSKSAYLNNFYLMLPDDAYEYGSYYRNLLVSIERMDLSPIEYRIDLETDKQMGASDLALHQKWREFFETIEGALTKEGISVDEVKRLQRLGENDFNKIDVLLGVNPQPAG